MASDFDPYHKWLGIPPEEQPPNHYRLLGIKPFEEDPDVVEAAADQRMRHLRTFQTGKHAGLSQRLLNEVAAARICLLNPEQKAGYDATLRHELEREETDKLRASPAAQPGPLTDQPAAPGLAVPKIDTSTRRRSHRRRSPPWLLPVTATGLILVGAGLLLAFLSGRDRDGDAHRGETSKSVASRPTPSQPKRSATTGGPRDAGNASGVRAADTQSGAFRPPLEPDRHDDRLKQPADAPGGSAPEQPTGVAASGPSAATRVAEEQRLWAEKLGAAVEITNSLGMQFVLIPPGEFDMGSAEEEVQQLTEEAREQGLDVHKWYSGRIPAEAPRHHVRITQAFYLGKYEVTVGQFRRFVEATGYVTGAETSEEGARGFVEETRQLDYRPGYNWRNSGFAQDEDHPVLNVSWNDAVAFCRWLSSEEGKTYRLPTEAEWEYACRAGTTTRFYSGGAIDTLRDMANLCDASCPLRSPPGQWVVPWDDGYPFTAPVGRFWANAFGLYDMHGNVWEWCQDWWNREYYSISPLEDPRGPESGTEKVCRGGCWFHFGPGARAAYRSCLPPDSCHDVNGFRVLLALVASPAVEPKPARLVKPEKAPVPAETDRQQALQHFDEIYAEKWSQARSPAEKRALAARLLAEAMRAGGTTPDDFVLLEKTRQIAIQAGDASIALQAIDELDQWFDVDALESKAAAMTDLAKAARLPGQRISLVEHALRVMDEAVESEDFGIARQLGQLALGGARRLDDHDLIRNIVARNSKAAELSEAYEKAKEAMAALKENPDDPGANLVLGRYLCLAKRDWEQGLAHLARGSDEELKAVAHRELSLPSAKAPNPIELADAWWDLAQPFKPPDNDLALLRAEHWYKQAERKARSALEKSKILSRLTDLSNVRYPNPDKQLGPGDALPTGLSIDLLRHIRLDRDRMAGEWVLTGQGLAVVKGVHPRVALPVTVDGEYDLEVGFVRTKGTAVSIFLPVGSRNCVMWFNALSAGEPVHSLNNVDGQAVPGNPGQGRTALVDGQPYLATISVRLQDDLASIEVLLNRKPLLQWSGRQASLSCGLAPGGRRPGLGANLTAVVFRSARLRLVSGEASLSE